VVFYYCCDESSPDPTVNRSTESQDTKLQFPSSYCATADIFEGGVSMVSRHEEMAQYSHEKVCAKMVRAIIP
jgi:hypothetical protein